MTDVLYDWPAAAKFGRVIPKAKFYEHGKVSNVLRERFVREVQRIMWAYKIADSTVNLPGTAAVPEIQLFHLETKGDDIAESVLAAIDGAVKTPVIFEISRGHGEHREVRMAAAVKQVGKAPKAGGYSWTGWLRSDARRRILPAAVDLESLYVAIVESLSGLSARPGEAVSEVAARLSAVRQLQREIDGLARKLRTEPQFNRKVELRRALKTKQSTLAAVTSSTPGHMSGTKD